MKSCLLCGVGGQGTILASRIIAAAAMEKGWFARTAETIGMAQRGGVVVSHVRVGESVPSPLIPPGMADVILSFEPGEAVRSLSYLKPGGLLIACDREVQPIAAFQPYDGAAMADWLRRSVPRCHVLDAQAICDACDSSRVLNVALVGALAASGEMGLSLEDVSQAMLSRVSEKYRDMNLMALKLGAQSITGEAAL